MEKVVTEVPSTADDFNPNHEFTVLFNLRFKGNKKYDHFGMLHVVWRAPLLPRGGDIVHIGGKLVIVMKIDKQPKRGDYLVWDDDCGVTIDAELLHITSSRVFLERVADLIDAYPEYRSRVRASLHIHEAVALKLGQQ